ncbi:MAG TPA: FeoB-associated Cys-rich membrane protein [Candidatus Synoicihabitans sp.]|nr:FeoB-associated Cys-rich membrane protein [Candidatus Synoicihabitans sp.]
MTPELQTILALLIVAGAVVWLGRRLLEKRRQSSCGPTCGAVSPDMKRLQSRLRK